MKKFIAVALTAAALAVVPVTAEASTLTTTVQKCSPTQCLTPPPCFSRHKQPCYYI